MAHNVNQGKLLPIHALSILIRLLLTQISKI
jgi:hypothetical protein